MVLHFCCLPAQCQSWPTADQYRRQKHAHSKLRPSLFELVVWRLLTAHIQTQQLSCVYPIPATALQPSCLFRPFNINSVLCSSCRGLVSMHAKVSSSSRLFQCTKLCVLWICQHMHQLKLTLLLTCCIMHLTCPLLASCTRCCACCP